MLRLNSYTHLFHIGNVNDTVDWVAKKDIFSINGKNDFIDKINAKPLEIVNASKYIIPCQATDSHSISNKDSENDGTKNAFKGFLKVQHPFKVKVLQRSLCEYTNY